MNWMVLVRRCILVLVIFCILGTLTQACHYSEEEEKCYKEDEQEEIIDKEKAEPSEESGSGITESKWFKILEKLIERYPIIERIIERIFQWIFNNLLGLDY